MNNGRIDNVLTVNFLKEYYYNIIYINLKLITYIKHYPCTDKYYASTEQYRIV